MKRYLPASGVALLLAACSGNGQPAASLSAAPVADLNQQFVSAWNAKDASKVTAMLADDVQFLQGATHFVGKQEVTNRWVTPTIGSIANLKTYSVRTGAAGDVAYDAGTFSVEVLPTPTEKNTGNGTGNYVFAWQKASDGTWKINMALLEDLPVEEKR